MPIAPDACLLPTPAAGHPEIADLLVSHLEQIGVEFVFGVPGGAIEPLYNALARSQRRGGPRPVVARHETGAAFMADGYARATGRMGVCCATTGPGTTNLITGVASAYENRIPMLLLTAQTALTNFGRGALQESSCTGVNTVAMLQHCTRYNTLVSHVDQFERKLITAILHAHRPLPGPVNLSIPLDILRAPAPPSRNSGDLAALLRPPSLLDDTAVRDLCRHIRHAGRIVFVIGEGADEAIGTLLEIALLLDAGIVATPHGKGLVNAFHPQFRGVIGFAGHGSAAEALTDPDVDTVIAVGTNLGEWSSDGWNKTALLNERLIHVDASESNLTRSPMARLQVRGRIAAVFERVLDYLYLQDLGRGSRPSHHRQPCNRLVRVDRREPPRQFGHDDEAGYRDHSTPIKPQRLMYDLARLFPAATRFLADSGNSLAWAIHYLHPRDRRLAGRRETAAGLFSGALEFASMGWAIGAAVGTALAMRNTPVVCITGDGSLLMSGQELTVAVQERLTVIFVVLNDSALGMVKHGQRLARAEAIAHDLPRIDYAACARALGAEGIIIESPQDMEALDVDSLCTRRAPTLLDVRIDPEAVPPIGARMKILGGET